MVVIESVTPAFAGRQSSVDIPEKIEAMLDLYEYEGGSFSQKCRNFYRQGKWMEEYEDDVPWTGAFRRYFPTYHDLNVRQLRGYFTWRTQVRKGVFHPITTSFAYLYVYELLNGIGVRSPEETLRKMREFEVGFLDSGIGDQKIEGLGLTRWFAEDHIFISGVIGMQKPDPRAFLHVQQALGLDPAKTWYIGDSPSCDVKGALDAGWHMLFFNRRVYLIITLIRNIIEPRIVGEQIGLHPLLMLLSMYLGIRFFGFLGLFLLPATLLLIKELNEKGILHIYKTEKEGPPA